MPWWAAVLIAVLGTAVGFAIDAGFGNRELSGVFAALYLIGCVAAVLAVRQEAVFTAVVQPPLILFVAVPGAYYLFHHSEIHGIKDILINCGYPLIERFLLMFTTSVIVLLIGMARWYFGAAAGPAASARFAGIPKSGAVPMVVGVLAAIKTKISALTIPGLGQRESEPEKPKRRRHAVDPTTRQRQRSRRSTTRVAPSRSRHVGRPHDDEGAPPPRRRGPAHARGDDFDGPAKPRRRAPRDPSRRTPPPEYLREPRQPRQRSPYERPDRSPYERPDRSPYERPDRSPYERQDRYGPAEPYDPPPPRKRPSPATGTHHPVSKVRYRGADTGDDGSGEDVHHRRRPRAVRGVDDRYRGYD